MKEEQSTRKALQSEDILVAKRVRASRYIGMLASGVEGRLSGRQGNLHLRKCKLPCKIKRKLGVPSGG